MRRNYALEPAEVEAGFVLTCQCHPGRRRASRSTSTHEPTRSTPPARCGPTTRRSRALGMELRDARRRPRRGVDDGARRHGQRPRPVPRRPRRRPGRQRVRAGLQLPRRPHRGGRLRRHLPRAGPRRATSWWPPPRSAPCAAAPASTTSPSAATTPSSPSSGGAAARCDSRAVIGGRSTAVGVSVEFTGLTKRFGSLTAVDHLSFTVAPGRVTGFLGPNGAGKTTTLRMLLGLVRPTSGTATIDGRRVRRARPARSRVVGAALEATDVHPGRSGRDHLRTIARGRRASPDSRVDELLELTGIPAFARKRAGGYSTGMRQRLALAAVAARRPAAARPRRACQRPRPRGHPLAARLPAPPLPTRARPCWSPATCCRRSSRPSTTS